MILCMLVAALDGFDTQAIGYTAPAIAGVLKLPMAQFGQVGSAGLVGAAIGALFLVFLMLARPTMEADAVATAALAE